MVLETAANLIGETVRGVRVIGNAIRTTSPIVRILLVAASLSWIAIGGGLALIGGPALFLPLMIWVIFSVLILSFIGDVFGGE